MAEIAYIPKADSNSSVDAAWVQKDSCAGFSVSDSCPWRYEEMDLISFIPSECLNFKVEGCDQLVSFARFNKRYEKV